MTPASLPAASAAPAADVGQPAELRGDVRDGADPAAAVDGDEDPLVGGRPRKQQPTAVRRGDDLAERAGRAEEHAPRGLRDDVRLLAVSTDQDRVMAAGKERRV